MSPRRRSSWSWSSRVATLLCGLAVLSIDGTAGAEPPDPGLVLLTGAAINVAGLIAGGTILANSHSDALNSAGWLTIEGSFVLAPFAAHALEGEWGRGALFTIVPAGCFGGSAALFAAVPNTVDYGSLPQQRLMWGLLLVGEFAAAIGVVDAAFAPGRRKVYVAPAVGAGGTGLTLGGVF